jgi:hypothetical protein
MICHENNGRWKTAQISYLNLMSHQCDTVPSIEYSNRRIEDHASKEKEIPFLIDLDVSIRIALPSFG